MTERSPGIPARASGLRIGMLVLVSPTRNAANRLSWVCKCDCGKTTRIADGNICNALRRKSNASCGCNRGPAVSKRNYRHGHAKTKIYGVYHSMLARCRDSNRWDWEYYGGRGISVCTSWQKSFFNFRDDMIAGYAEGLELDRIDCDGDYEKDNCRWVTRLTQMRNLRYNTYARMSVEDLL